MWFKKNNRCRSPDRMQSISSTKGNIADISELCISIIDKEIRNATKFSIGFDCESMEVAQYLLEYYESIQFCCKIISRKPSVTCYRYTLSIDWTPQENDADIGIPTPKEQ